MPLPPYRHITVKRYRKGRLDEIEHPFSTEYPVQIIINGIPYGTIACSGEKLEYLAAGILLSEQIITSSDQFRGIDFDEENLVCAVSCDPENQIYENSFSHRRIFTSGGRSVRELPDDSFVRKSLPGVNPLAVLSSMKRFLSESTIHDLTRGVHSSSLIDPGGKETVFFDEIGRHNAIDKVFGFAVMKKVDVSGLFLLTTGRISSEIVMKCVYGGVPVLISRAAPTSYAVELLRRYNILAITHVKGEEFLVINGSEMIEPAPVDS